ncbi:cutinase family protein [Rhodococcus hoagii]|nr:cutinase family protein [Prescottella equi]NKS10209.1 cutinase family protein [Prescottella equi]NKS35200.1 cutinase family protein [Prescottella equi]NKS35259.1 cutinase family protein [Prescottella equi]NKS62106.1 cutinase family protein [Prescottella equi]
MRVLDQRHLTAPRPSRIAEKVTLAAIVAALASASVPAVATAQPTSTTPGLPAVSSEDCGDVNILAVPGTWETNESADRKVVPGMLSQITGPLAEALTTPPAFPDFPTVTPYTTTSVAPTTTAAPTSTLSGAVSTTKRSTTSATATATAPKIKVVSEQIPYIAQVGGPIAGIVTGNPITLKESKANGMAALESRASQLAKACPLSKFVVLGYSQGAVVAGDFLSKVGNRQGAIEPSRILAGALLSDPSRSPSTPDPEAETPVAKPTKLSAASETMIGPNVNGQGVLGARDKGMGVLAERVTSFCAPNDTICSLSGKSKAVAAVVPLLNLTPEDLPEYALNKGLELVRNVASAKPADIQKAATSVITQMTRLSVASAVSPATLPMELARVVFASTMLDDVARVVNMPEFDALVSLTHPEELVQQATQVAAYLLLDAHRSYANYPVDETGDTATQWVVKWVTAKVQASV